MLLEGARIGQFTKHRHYTDLAVLFSVSPYRPSYTRRCSPQNLEKEVSVSSASNLVHPQPETHASVYVHFMSGEVATIRPATSVVVQSEMVLVYNGSQPVASYPRREVFSCSKTPTSPILA